MKRYGFLCLSSLALAALVLSVSCASPQGAKPSATKPQPEKQRKERIVVTKVPVLVKETSLYADGLVDEWFVYKYDSGFMTLASKETFDSSRADAIERLVTEVVNGRITGDNIFDAEGKVRTRHEYQYDAAGNEIAEKVLDSKGQTQSSSSYAWDSKGNRTEWKAFDAKGVLKAVTTYTYADGKPSLITMKDGTGNLTGSIALENDSKGLVAKKTYKAPDGSVQKTETYAYSNGLPVTVEIRRADGALVLKTVNTYGELGQLLTTVTTDAAGSIKDRRTFEYTIREDSKTEVYYE